MYSSQLACSKRRHSSFPPLCSSLILLEYLILHARPPSLSCTPCLLLFPLFKKNPSIILPLCFCVCVQVRWEVCVRVILLDYSDLLSARRPPETAKQTGKETTVLIFVSCSSLTLTYLLSNLLLSEGKLRLLKAACWFSLNPCAGLKPLCFWFKIASSKLRRAV